MKPIRATPRSHAKHRACFDWRDSSNQHEVAPDQKIGAYWGQRTSGVHGSYIFLTYDLGKVGIPGGQFQVAAAKNIDTWISYFPNNLVLNNLGYYQTLFDKQLEFRIGILGNNYSFFGSSVGGSLTSPFGPSASIPSLMGVSQSGQPAPTLDIRWNINDPNYIVSSANKTVI
jgi:hypothetical protein